MGNTAMTRLFASDFGCKGATLENGHSYNADGSGFVHANDSADIKNLVSGGYVIAGGMPRLNRYWLCECGWESAINSCPHCQRNDLTKIVK